MTPLAAAEAAPEIGRDADGAPDDGGVECEDGDKRHGGFSQLDTQWAWLSMLIGYGRTAKSALLATNGTAE